MRNKMDNNMKPENEQEQKIAQILENLRNSEDVRELTEKIQKIAQANEVKRVRHRVKETYSAIRTFRKTKMKNISDAHDYCGYTLITEDETTIPDIITQIKEILPNAEYLDFTAEENLYLPYFKIKKCPPLSYIILARELTQNNMDFPIEIRVCSKEGFISEQAPYYTIWKNDELDFEERHKLRDICQHITYKLAILDMRKSISDEEKEKHIRELKNVINNNKAYLAEHKNVFDTVIAEYGRLVYEFENHDSILSMNANLTEEQQDDVIECIRDKYLSTFKSFGDLVFVNRINQTTNSIRKIKYNTFLDEAQKREGEVK